MTAFRLMLRRDDHKLELTKILRTAVRARRRSAQRRGRDIHAKSRPEYIRRSRKSHALWRDAVQIDEHLEEIDLAEIRGTICQRHEELAALTAPLRDGFLDDGDA